MVDAAPAAAAAAAGEGSSLVAFKGHAIQSGYALQKEAESC